jgi:hypothetical protein
LHVSLLNCELVDCLTEVFLSLGQLSRVSLLFLTDVAIERSYLLLLHLNNVVHLAGLRLESLLAILQLILQRSRLLFSEVCFLSKPCLVLLLHLLRCFLLTFSLLSSPAFKPLLLVFEE